MATAPTIIIFLMAGFITSLGSVSDFINHVNKYAMDHYCEGGWDEVIEAWSDGDILEYWSDADGDTKKAFKEIAKTVQLRHKYAEEIRSAKF